jgi:hypothetical protein
MNHLILLKEMLKEMSREYLVFDKSGCSERIILFHVRDFTVSAFEIDGFQHEGNGFKEAMALGVGALENAKLSGGLSIPFLEEEFSWASSSCEAAASVADQKKKQQQHVEMADDEESNCYSGENRDEIEALLDLGDKLADTADSMEVPDHRGQRIEETFEMLRNLVGGDWMDTVEVLDEAIRRVKRLQMDLKNLNDSRDI